MNLRITSLALLFLLLAHPALAEPKWFKGNTHTHSLWSDGNDFPEMIVDWYQRHGYNFLALSDHNVLHQGEKWQGLDTIQKRQRAIGRSALEKYRERFPADWIETRKEDDNVVSVRIKTLEEYAPLFNKPGEFLLIPAEEISNTFNNTPIHINAINLQDLIPVQKGESVTEVIRNNLQAARAQEKETGQPILVHLNHPNFQWAVSPRDIAEAVEDRFFEVYNGHPIIHHLGDKEHPGDEALWDIANTIRITELNAPPLFGVATDDSHTYHGGDVKPGRGWVMVRAHELSPAALIKAMRAGDFYASSGVTLDTIAFDPKTKTLSLAIHPDQDASFSTEFIGTRKNGDQIETGVVFKSQAGPSPSYTLKGDELYVRATITASTPHPRPSFEGQKIQAWTQPVGW